MSGFKELIQAENAVQCKGMLYFLRSFRAISTLMTRPNRYRDMQKHTVVYVKYKYEAFLLNIRGVLIKRKQYKVLSTKGYLVNLTRLVAHYVCFGLIMLISPFIYPIRADLSL